MEFSNINEINIINPRTYDADAEKVTGTKYWDVGLRPRSNEHYYKRWFREINKV